MPDLPAAAPPSPRPRAPVRTAVRWTFRIVALLALVWAGRNARTWQRLAADYDAASARHAEGVVARFEQIAPLSRSDAAQLSRAQNAAHLAAARRLGIHPVGPLDSLDVVADREGMARLDLAPGASGYVATEGRFSRPRLVPLAARRLDTLAAAFRDSLRARGLPDVALVVTSALRSSDSQRALAEVNEAATRGISAHTFGTTFDLTYRRFPLAALGGAAPPDPPPGLPAPLRAWARARAESDAAETYQRAALAHADRLDALLGRTLLAQQQAGRLLALRERTQPVYHVTADASR